MQSLEKKAVALIASLRVKRWLADLLNYGRHIWAEENQRWSPETEPVVDGLGGGPWGLCPSIGVGTMYSSVIMGMRPPQPGLA